MVSTLMANVMEGAVCTMQIKKKFTTEIGQTISVKEKATLSIRKEKSYKLISGPIR